MTNILNRAKEVLKIEAESISNLIDKIDSSFEDAVNKIKDCNGRVIITGMGKAGLIGRKISATLASTGTPSLFLHPAEAVHGDLGMILKDDVVITMSNSGETEEVIRLLPLIKKMGCVLIAITGNIKSTLAKNSDIVLNAGVKKEACSLGLAPTSSTTAALALGDALAVVLLDIKGFKMQDYAFLHAGGELGRKLTLKVSDVMRKGVSNPLISPEKTVKEAIDIITQKKAGAVTITNEKQELLGIFTDGDLRRKYLENKNIGDKKIKDVMTVCPITINKDKLAVEGLKIMQQKAVDEVPVVDDNNTIVGMLDIQDLIAIMN